MNVFTFAPVEVDSAEFVRTWSARYDYRLDPNYEKFLKTPHSRESLQALFEWKNGSRLSKRKQSSIDQYYLSRVDALNALDPETPAERFLTIFGGGAIWRIFLLHCWAPLRYPIYDQHVHRAMTFMKSRVPTEIPLHRPKVIRCYLEEYLPFHRGFHGNDQRDVDRALWAFGKFLKRLKPIERER